MMLREQCTTWKAMIVKGLKNVNTKTLYIFYGVHGHSQIIDCVYVVRGEKECRNCTSSRQRAFQGNLLRTHARQTER